jgi:O-Antigen ligase
MKQLQSRVRCQSGRVSSGLRFNAPAIPGIADQAGVDRSEFRESSSAVYCRNSTLSGLIEVSFVSSIFLAVAGFGGSEPLSWSISQGLIFLTAVVLILSNRGLRRGFSTSGRFVLAALAIWVFIQWVGSFHGVIGLDPYAIKFRGMAFATAIAGFFIAFEISLDRAARNRLVRSLIGLAVFESLYGLAQNPGGWQYIWVYRRVYYTGSATGTYINHNHFAGLLEMILPLTFALAFYHWRKAARNPRRRRRFVDWISRIGHVDIATSVVLMIAAVLIVVAIAFSLSRMGIISALFSVLVLVAFMYAGRQATRLNWKLLFVCISFSAIVASWIGAGPVVEHFARLSHDEPLAGNHAEGRLALWRDVGRLIGSHPVTGVGLGCFEFAFTRFQTTELTLIIDHAHNDYLELAAELGIPAAAVFFGLIFAVLARSTRASLRSPSYRDRAIGFGAIAGASALLLHGVVDFNFYIPANGLVFTVLLGVSRSI